MRSSGRRSIRSTTVAEAGPSSSLSSSALDAMAGAAAFPLRMCVFTRVCVGVGELCRLCDWEVSMSQRDGHSFTFLSLFLLLLSQYRAAALHYAMESSLFVSFGSAPSGTRDAGQDAPPLSCCYDPRLLFLPSLSSPAPSPRLSRSSHTKQGRLPLTLDPRVDSQQCLSQGQQKERRRQMRLATCTSRHSPSPPLLDLDQNPLLD